MDPSTDLLDHFARARDRSRGYRCPVERRSIDDGGTVGQVHRVEVVAHERVLDQVLHYLRVERSHPVRHVTALVGVAEPYPVGTRGTATFRPRAGTRGGTWEFEPAGKSGAKALDSVGS